MSLAVPSALFLAALAIPIIFFYILKVRLRRLEVSTNLFWKQVYDEKPPRSLWQYLRHLLSLLLQLVILIFLVFAVADPYFPWQLLQARKIVAVIDNSASMQADHLDTTRFEAAIEEAISLVEGLRYRDEMALVLAGPQSKVVLGMTGHIPTLKRALNNIQVSDNPTSLTSALELGYRLINDHPRGQIIVFTDGCVEELPETTLESPTDQIAKKEKDAESSVDSLSTQEIAVDYRIFGEQAGNLGITQFQVRRSLVDPLGYELLIAVRNASEQKVSCRLEIELDEAPVDILPLDLEPDETWSRSIEKTSLEGGQLVAKLSQIALTAENNFESDTSSAASVVLNALIVDDSAWAILPPRKSQQVLLVTPGNLFLHKVLESNPLVQVEVVSNFPDTWPSNTITVLHGNVPQKLPSGDLFVVDPTDGCDAWQLGQPLENPIITELDENSPLLTHVRLDNVLVPEARQVNFSGQSHTLAGSLSKSPIYAEYKRPEGKCLVLTVNLDRSDLAFRTAFPIMMTNALGWFAGTSGELRESFSTGSIYAWDTENQELNSELISLISPTGKRSDLSTQANTLENTQEANATKESMSVSVGPFDECGIWSVQQPSEDKTVDASTLTQFAVNLSDQRESDLRPHEAFAKLKEPDPLLAGWFAKPVWFYLVSAGCLLSVIEWILYHRRFIS